MNDILNTILKDTYTLSSLKHRIRVLKAYLISQIFTDQKQTQELGSKDVIWLRSLGGDFYKQFNKDNIYPIFEGIENKVKDLEPLYIYLPFELDDQTTGSVGQMVRKSLGKPLLYETKFDPNLVAGCAMSFKGVYKDYSLHSRIEEKKQEISESFKKFLR